MIRERTIVIRVRAEGVNPSLGSLLYRLRRIVDDAKASDVSVTVDYGDPKPSRITAFVRWMQRKLASTFNWARMERSR